MSDVDSPEFWQSIYKAGATHWDLGGTTPVFCTLAESGKYPPGRMIVLGAGRGYDARMFARKGFTVTAVDFASEAVRDMQMLAKPDAPVAALRADIFKLPPFFKGTFDYVLEYVTYCAIDPSRRGDYADVVADLLAPSGRFIGLIFPLGCHEGGPPFAVDADELVRKFEQRGLRLVHREFPEDSIKPRKGREELIIVEKPGPSNR